MSWIAHIDADAFYVNAERVRHPDLIGKPVGVIGNQGACVIAKSDEMKACGVKTGEAIWDPRPTTGSTHGLHNLRTTHPLLQGHDPKPTHAMANQ